MTNFVIFERSVAQGLPDSDLLVRLRCDKANEVSNCIPLSVNVVESFGKMTPIVTVSFIDGSGDLFNHMKIDTSAIFTLEYGRNAENLIKLDLRVSKVELVNGEFGRPSKIEFKIVFVLKNWYESIGKKHNRGWFDKTVSEIVTELAAESSFDNTYISNTEVKYESTIQDHIDNGKMFAYLKDCAYVEGNDSHFEYGVNSANEFFFKNMDLHFDDYKSDINGRNISVFRLQNVLEKVDSAKEEVNRNKIAPAYFYGFRNVEHYLTPVVTGASGMRSVYYDFFTDELKTEDHSFADLNVSQWSDYSSLREEDTGNIVLMEGGRDSDTPFLTKTKLAELNMSMQQFDITTNGAPLLSIFDFVEIIVPNTVLNSKVLINQLYSGIYLVGGVKHTFDLQSLPRMNTILTLYRHGVDDFDHEGLLDNLVISATGKGF